MILRHLDIWTAAGMRDAVHDSYAALDREEINAYTVKKLKEQLLRAVAEYDEYKKLYKDYDIQEICQMDDAEFMAEYRTLPPAAPEMADAAVMNEADQKNAAEFYNHGMRLMMDPGDTVLVLLDAEDGSSLGSLIARGVSEMGAKAIAYGLPVSIKDEADKIIEIIRNENVTSIAARPTHMIKLSREAERAGITDYDSPDYVQLRSILLCEEYAPEETVMMLEETFECCIYEHYSAPAMGTGCAVSCGFGNGYHVNERDLYIELVDPRNGETVPYGSYGEIVFSTLTREGMPLLRYRTGEFSRWIVEPCMCGSQLKRLDNVGSKDIIKEMLINKLHGGR